VVQGFRFLRSSRFQLALIVTTALVLRGLFFVGFALGDDLGYLGHVDLILNGGYPPLDPLNQYAYRPLLLFLFAGGVALFGHTDVGVVAPVLAASLLTTALVFVLVRKLIDPAAAWWCALIYAFQPFNVVNSTTMTNDVILACLTFASLGLFLLGDRCQDPAGSRIRFAASGAIMLAAFLVKISLLPVVCAIALYSFIALRTRPAVVLQRHSLFYLTLLAGLCCVCLAYYVKTGDFFWQFKSEVFYYQTHKPDWYLAGAIDYSVLMWQYPRSLFGLSGYDTFRYLEHGFLFWLFVPASAFLLIARGNGVVKFLIAATVMIFAFFQFYPQHVTPRYLPLVRQERYLEMLLPAATIVVGTALHLLYRQRPVLAVTILCLLLGDFVVEASRRSTLYNESQQDMRELARYARSTISRTNKRLAVDLPARNALLFYLRDVPVGLDELGPNQLAELGDCYVAVGGARSFWWSRTLVVDLERETVPAHWALTYEVPARIRPWRPSILRVYYVNEPPKEGYAVFDAPQPPPPTPLLEGLEQAAYPDGFAGKAVASAGGEIPDLDNSSVLPAPRLEWSGWLLAEDALYTFESTSDDGSWIYLNDRLMLDNGGVHPARPIRRTIRLAKGWYRFRLRYEDVGGGRFLRFRVYRNRQPSSLPQRTLLFSTSTAGAGR
jgi:hypothetical protein